MSLDSINKAIRKIDPRCELVKGDGYHYLVWDDLEAGAFETKSIMVMYTAHLDREQWISEAQDFIRENQGN